jgi:hypothetical protein
VSDKTKKFKKGKKNKDKGKDKKLSKKQRIAEREAKKAARKGDGSFPDTMIITKNENGDNTFFEAHNGDDLSTLDTDGETVAVYKLRKVSTIAVSRKITR